MDEGSFGEDSGGRLTDEVVYKEILWNLEALDAALFVDDLRGISEIGSNGSPNPNVGFGRVEYFGTSEYRRNLVLKMQSLYFAFKNPRPLHNKIIK